MRRWYILLVSFIMACLVLISFGCTKPAPPAGQSPAQAPASSASAAAVAPAVQPIQWKVQTNWGTGMLYFQMAQKFVDRVKAASGGRLILTLQPAGALAADNAILDACSTGTFEAYLSSPTYWVGKSPVGTFLLSVPFTFTDFWQRDVWFYQLGGIDIARANYDRFNCYFIGIFTPDGGSEEPVYMGEKNPIRTVADFKGKKIRFTGGIQADIMSKLGVSVVDLPGTEVYSALQSGVLDGAKTFGIKGSWDLGLHEVSKWLVNCSIQGATTLEIVANKNAWNKLPSDLQALLLAASREYEWNTFSQLHVTEMKVKADLEKHGNTFINFPSSELDKLREAAMPVIETYAAKDEFCQKAWASQKSYLQQLGILK